MIQVTYKMGHKDGYGAWYKTIGPSHEVGILFELKNLSEKTIKYCTLYFIPYNAVNDAVSCNESSISERGIEVTGPIAANKTAYNLRFEYAWFNPTITYIVLSKAEIEYTDGSTETIQGNEITKVQGGCYIATSVYGSYDCPQVWTLRRFRDNNLYNKRSGRTFIKLYYAISPTLVRYFGNSPFFKKVCHKLLNIMVKKLQNNGYKSTPYEDKDL